MPRGAGLLPAFLLAMYQRGGSSEPSALVYPATSNLCRVPRETGPGHARVCSPAWWHVSLARRAALRFVPAFGQRPQGALATEESPATRPCRLGPTTAPGAGSLVSGLVSAPEGCCTATDPWGPRWSPPQWVTALCQGDGAHRQRDSCPATSPLSSQCLLLSSGLTALRHHAVPWSTGAAGCGGRGSACLR